MSGNSEQCEGGEENPPESNFFLSDIFVDVRRQTSESLERTSLGRSIKTSRNGLKVAKAGHKSEGRMGMMADRHNGQLL